MALTVETGAIVSGADTYIDIADTTTFLEQVYGEYDDNAAAFLGLATKFQEQVLRKAAWFLNIRYRLKWKGFKVTSYQDLDWPRTDVQDEDDYDVPEDSIPAAVKRAQVEIAIRIANAVAIFADRDRGGLIKSEKVDVIAVTYFNSAPAQTVFEEIDATLRGLLKNEQRLIRA